LVIGIFSGFGACDLEPGPGRENKKACKIAGFKSIK
jgi:hypothetical protein